MPQATQVMTAGRSVDGERLYVTVRRFSTLEQACRSAEPPDFPLLLHSLDPSSVGTRSLELENALFFSHGGLSMQWRASPRHDQAVFVLQQANNDSCLVFVACALADPHWIIGRCVGRTAFPLSSNSYLMSSGAALTMTDSAALAQLADLVMRRPWCLEKALKNLNDYDFQGAYVSTGCFVLRHSSITTVSPSMKCVECGADAVGENEVRVKNLHYSNPNLHFSNPVGEMFNLILAPCSPSDDGLLRRTSLGDPQAEHSWFHGFGWSVLVHSSCGSFLGWRFTFVGVGPPKSSFDALISSRLGLIGSP